MLLNIFGSKLLSFWLNLDYILDKKYPPTPAPSEKKQLILAFSGGSGGHEEKSKAGAKISLKWPEQVEMFNLNLKKNCHPLLKMGLYFDLRDFLRSLSL